MSDVTAHLGRLVSGEPSVLINGKPAVRLGDIQVCPQHGPSVVVTAAPLVWVNGAPLARVLDLTMCTGGGKAGSGGGGGGPSFDASAEGPTARQSGPGKGQAHALKSERSVAWWMFGVETETYLGHYQGEIPDENDPDYSAEAAGFEEITTYKIADVTILKVHEKALTAEIHDKGFIGESEGKSGLYGKQGIDASWGSKSYQVVPPWVDVANLLLNPVGYDVDATISASGSEGVGKTAEAGAYHDSEDGRIHIVGKGMLSIVKGLGVGFEMSIGKSDGGANASGQGAIPNPITTGSPDVFLG